MSEAHVNIFAVIIAAVIYFFLGGLWYSPKLFGHIWIEELKITAVKHDSLSYILEGVIGLIMASILALFMSKMDLVNVGGGFLVALLIWVGFIATTGLSGVLWGKKTLKLFFVHSGFLLVTLLLMGMIIGLLS
jgi:hypothetical protein